MSAEQNADAVIVGGGLVGLACAAALARDGARAILVDDPRPGAASPAGAGVIAPSIEQAAGPAHDFAVAARDRYPGYLDWLADETGVAVPINAWGILQVAVTERGVRGLRRAMPDGAEWIAQPGLTALEPELLHALGAVHHPFDGAVDNVALLDALGRFCALSERIAVRRGNAVEASIGARDASIRTADGARYGGRVIVLAAGAWAPAIRGLPRSLPVSPARGQMLAFDALSLSHVLFGPRGYIVPRLAHGSAPAETMVGATTEHVGFDVATTDAGADTLRSIAEDVLPQLSGAAPTRHWAGLRPMTPDLLPILGHDPDAHGLLYACGHSRNGILMAPLTGDCVSALVRGEPVGPDLTPFRVDRFDA